MDSVLSMLRASGVARRPTLGRQSLSILADRLPYDTLPTLLDRSSEAAASGEERAGGAEDVRLFFELILRRMIEEADPPPDPSMLWTWIVSVLGQSAEGPDPTKKAIARLCEDDRYLSDLFVASLRHADVEDLTAHVRWSFWSRTGRNAWSDLGTRLLALAEAEPDEARARELFGLGLQQAWDQGREDLALFEAAADMAARGRFTHVFEERSRVPFKWRLLHQEMESKSRAKLENGRLARRARLAASRAEVVEGRDPSALDELANIYLGLAEDVDEAAPSLDRLVAATDPETAADTIAGFAKVVALLPADPNDPGGSAQPGPRSPWPLVAWFMATPNDAPALSALSDGALAAIAAALVEQGPVGAYVVGGHAKVREWLDDLAARRPDILTGVIETSARRGLAARDRHVPALDGLIHEPALAGIARSLVPRMLADYPGAHPDSLESLMAAAVAHVPGDELLALAEGVLRDDRVSGIERAMWLAVRFLRRSDGTGLDAMQAHATDSEESF